MAGLEVEEIRETEGEPVFVTYVTPNRSDLLSMFGVAREISALLGRPLRQPDMSVAESEPAADALARIEIQSPVNCPRYSARVITDTRITESPEWMRKRLIAAGMRPINNVVDATNYVLLELGQPLHAFDYDLLADHHVIVRQADPGEKIITIDGEERTLTSDTLVIADPKHAVAIAGVMGGYDSEVNSRTTNVLLESAHFNRLSIRRTARKIALSTEASYRFERGVDPNLTVRALDRVSRLIQETGGGAIARGVVDVYPQPVEPRTIELRADRTRDLLGMPVTDDQAADYLLRLGMDVTRGNKMQVTVPTFRMDIEREVDLIEEVGRVHGYEQIPETLPSGESMQGADSEQGTFEARITDLLVSCGLQEAVTSTMTPPDGNASQVPVRNPLSDDLGYLRRSLVPNLLSVLSHNAGRGVRDLGVFEVGQVFEPTEDGAIVERGSVAGAIVGTMWDGAWNVDKNSLQADFFLCKGIVEALLERIGLAEIVFTSEAIPGLHPGRGAAIHSGGDRLGIIGEASAERTEALNLPSRAYVFELDLDALMNGIRTVEGYRTVSRYPASTRDIAVVVPDDVAYRSVQEVIVKGAGELLESVDLFDLYQGQPLPAGQKSLAFSIVFRSTEKTLRDEEVDERLKYIRELLVKELSASFR